MKIKLALITISSLFIIPAYANKVIVSKEEIFKQIMLKEEQLDFLSKAIAEVEASIHLSIKNIHEIAGRARDHKKQELLKEKSWFFICDDQKTPGF